MAFLFLLVVIEWYAPIIEAEIWIKLTIKKSTGFPATIDTQHHYKLYDFLFFIIHIFEFGYTTEEADFFCRWVERLWEHAFGMKKTGWLSFGFINRIFVRLFSLLEKKWKYQL